MRINWISIKGFKNYLEKREFTFGSFNIIRGENALGKSSIADAIAWVLTGCNAFGLEKASGRIVNKKAKTTKVEINFEHGGVNHNVKRIKIGKVTDIYLDGNKATNIELCDKFLIGKDYFFSVFNPFYFISLSPSEAKSFLLSILPKVSDDSVFNLLGEYSRDILVGNGFKSGSKFIEERRKEIAEISEDIIYCHGIIDGQSTDFIVDEEEMLDENRIVYLEEELSRVFLEINSDDHKRNFNYILNEFKVVETKLKELNKPEYNHILTIAQKLEGLCTELREYEVAKSKNISAGLSYIENLIKDITKLKILAAVAKVNNQNKLNIVRHKEKVQSKIDETKRKIVEDTERIKKLNLLIDLAKKFYAKKLELESISINKYLDKASIQFQKLVKSTGEIKDDFKILYEMRELNTLSHSEKIKAGLEISNLVMQIIGVKFPIFIDDAESITKYNKPHTQIIEARVERESNLVVESYEQ